MHFQIKKVILWPRDKKFSRREVSFELGKVNVITGASKTGKSAIIPIIDYCLGSGKCLIPVKTIRDNCEWFGVLIDTEFGEKLFARREPGQQQSTDDMFVLEGESVEIPERITEKNSNASNVKTTLDQLSGLTNLDFDFAETGDSFKERPSFRDMAAFNFQPQNIIANQATLFFKIDTLDHKQKLAMIFPYILGAITPAILAKQHELARLNKELRKKNKELQSIRDVSERWVATIQSKFSQAKELGLINKVDSQLKTEEIVSRLRDVVNSTSLLEAKITEENITESVNELVELNKEEAIYSRELSVSRKRCTEMTKLKETIVDYKDALLVERDRLKISEWIKDNCSENSQCVMCGSNSSPVTKTLDDLTAALKEVEKSAEDHEQIPVAFDREFEKVKKDIYILTEKLKGVRIRIQNIEKESEEIQKIQYKVSYTWSFIGALKESMQVFDSLQTDGDLVQEVEGLQKRVKELTDELSKMNLTKMLESLVRKIELNAGKIVAGLDVENPNDPIKLIVRELTLKVIGNNREDYLWELGSGANWLGYHIAVSLGLQQFFITTPRNPVPSFIIYDQPSQVYFPKNIHVSSSKETYEFRDDDIEALQKLFKVIDRIVGETKNKLQVIVLDHAPESIWRDLNLSNIKLVEEWREGKKLVPINWLER